MMIARGNQKTTVLAAVSRIVALLVSIWMVVAITSFANEVNAVVRQKYPNEGLSLRVATALEKEFRKRAEEGLGLESFFASKILGNRGLGYPEAGVPTGEVIFFTSSVASIIGMIVAMRGGTLWGTIVILIALFCGGYSVLGSLASITIFWSGAIGGIAALLTCMAIGEQHSQIYKVNLVSFSIVVFIITNLLSWLTAHPEVIRRIDVLVSVTIGEVGASTVSLVRHFFHE